jgi:predicted ATPase/DNA-binding CsgD family transcriptional regulator
MHETLTPREREILEWIARGLTNQQIADRLGLTRGTVKAHTHNIYSKLDVADRGEARLRASALGLITFDEQVSTDADTDQPELSPLTPLIGRSRELGELSAMLADERIRLITLLGAGGMGKTRLALEITRRASQDLFKDGVTFIPLAAVADVKNLAATIIDRLHLRFQSGEQPESQLVAHLRDRQALLVLDNYEHLVDDVDLIMEILQAVPGVKLLVTSRERLNLTAEVVYVLGGLAVDPSGEAVDEAAAQLLLRRASFVSPALHVQDADRLHIQRICQYTQGMPLGLILAAGWLDTLTLQEVADELGRSIDILDSQLRDLPARQRSMRATIASSWERLTESERRIFASLSVFRGGFTRHAAQAIGGADARSLQNFVSRSLVTAGGGRYEIHELLRQYGLEILQRATHAAELYSRHSEYFLDWLRAVELDLKGRQQIETLKALSRDIDNLRQAWHWAIQTARFDLIDRALESVYALFTILSRLQEGADLLQAALDRLQADVSANPALIIRLRIRCGLLLLVGRSQELRVTELEACVADAEQHSNTVEIALAVSLLSSYFSYVERDFKTAIALDERAIALLEGLGEKFHLATIYHKHGYAHLQATGMDRLIHFTEKAYQAARQTGNLYNMQAALSNLGSAALYLGRYQEAENYYRESVPMISAAQHSATSPFAIYFAHILLLRGKFEEAEDQLRAGWSGDRDTLEINVIGFGHAMNGLLALLHGDAVSALAQAQEGLNIVRDDLTVTLVANLIAGMACCALKDTDRAEAYLREAWGRSQQMNYYASATWGLPILVLTRLQRTDYESAAEYAALLRSHPLSATGWLDRWPLLVAAEAHIKRALPPDTYRAACQRGESMSIEDVVAGFLNAMP